MKNVNKKLLIVTIVALVLAISCVVGTFAYLAVRTKTITNTFTSGNVAITLDETTGTSYKMIPGDTITKNPVVTVKAGSEASWVFVKVVSDTKAVSALTYSVNTTAGEGETIVWTKLEGVDNVYYAEVGDLSGQGATDVKIEVIEGNVVNVKNIDAETLKDAEGATISITAYAIQKDGLTSATAAWDEVKDLDEPAA